MNTFCLVGFDRSDKFFRFGIENLSLKRARICDRGDPADMITSAAERNNVDMIVMGSRGLGGFSRTIMGNVSTKVCNRAHCTAARALDLR